MNEAKILLYMKNHERKIQTAILNTPLNQVPFEYASARNITIKFACLMWENLSIVKCLIPF